MLWAMLHRLGMIAALVWLPGLAVAQAQQGVSAWDEGAHAGARLIAGAMLKSEVVPHLRAGLEIHLEPGWKTYWRYPGDSGVPPTLDFTDSENVTAVTVLWPAPQRFADGAGGNSIGYHGDIILPLRITAKDAAKPSSLRVRLSYVVCGKLCVPAEADLNVVLSGAASGQESALVAAEARVPRHVPLGSGSGLAIRSVHRERGDGPDRVVVEVAAPRDAPVDLFVEGPAATWALPVPEPIDATSSGAPGVRRFAFELDGLPPGASVEGATLTFTAVSRDEAIEVAAHLD